MSEVISRAGMCIHVDLFAMLSQCFGELATDEVILLHEREDHIRQRHDGAMEVLDAHGKECVEEPEYIFVDPKNKDTVWFIRSVEGSSLKLVIRLALARDGTDRKNSIITAHLLGEKTLGKNIRNKMCIYRRE